MSYAERTQVAESQSRAEIERILSRYGADQFAYGWEADKAAIKFRAYNRYIRMILYYPKLAANAKPGEVKKHEQERRRLWRSLALVLKAKLESVTSGIATFEEEFMPYILLPDGSTVGEFMLPQIEASYSSGTMPRSLLALPPGRKE